MFINFFLLLCFFKKRAPASQASNINPASPIGNKNHKIFGTVLKNLGSDKKISWRKEAEAIEIDLPEIESKELGYALELIR